jgi:hypothetical protein
MCNHIQAWKIDKEHNKMKKNKIPHYWNNFKIKYMYNKGNAKRGVSPHLNIRPCDLDLWPWKSIGFQILLRSKYVPSLVKIHWRMLILVFTRMLRGKNLTPWPLTLKINRVPDSPKDYVCTKFGQNLLKDVDSREFTRMLCHNNLTRWHWPLTYDIENQ